MRDNEIDVQNVTPMFITAVLVNSSVGCALLLTQYQMAVVRTPVGGVPR